MSNSSQAPSFDLTLQQKFELERQLRAIDDENDIDKIKSLCQELIRAWHVQCAATRYFMAQTLPIPPRQS